MKKAVVDFDQVEKGRMVDVDQVEEVVDVDHCLFHGRQQAALFITPCFMKELKKMKSVVNCAPECDFVIPILYIVSNPSIMV